MATYSVGEEELNALASSAQAGDAAARNTLWELTKELVDSAVMRQRILPRLWDRDDLRQEAFVVFAEVVEVWSGEPVAVYLEREYQPALARHVRRIQRKQAREGSVPVLLELEPDAEAEQIYRLTELLEGLSRLPRPMELALCLHLVLGMPLAQVGRQLGLRRRELGQLLPLARRAATERPETESERLERQVRELYAFADSWGRIRATSRQVRASMKLGTREHAELMEELERCGVLAGRSRGHSGRLPASGPEAAIRLLRRHRDARSA